MSARGTSGHGSGHIRIPVAVPGAGGCGECVLRVREAADGLAGVGSVEVVPGASELDVEFDPNVVSGEEIVIHLEQLGHEVAATITHASWQIGGLDCPDCARTVDRSVSLLDGVITARLNFANAILVVEYDAAGDPRRAIESQLLRMGYTAVEIGDAAGRPVAEFRLVGLDCPDCSDKLVIRARSWRGVEAATVDFTSAHLRIGYEPTLTSAEELAAALEAAGYAVELVDDAAVAGRAGRQSWLRRGDVATVASGLLIAVAWGLAFVGAAEVLTIACYALAILVGGGMIFRRALSSVRARSLDMNVLMTVAVIGAAGIGEWAEGAAVVFLFSIGGLLEARSLARTRSSIRELMDLAPQVAHVMRGGDLSDVSPSEVGLGDHIVIRAGERVPLDGVVIAGSSAMDESPITGESIPVDKEAGDVIYAGSLNAGGVLSVSVTARSADTTLARIIYLVEEAQAQQAPFQRIVDRFTRYYTPAVVALAAFVAVAPPALALIIGASWGGFDVWFYRALVLLVVSCPCALVISTPVAVVSAITRAAHDGILIKGGAFLEAAANVRAVALDKTGTLTMGRPEVAEVLAANSEGAAAVLATAAALEVHSSHPLARAVVRAAGDGHATAEPGSLTEVAGRGITGDVAGSRVLVGSSEFAVESGVDLSQFVEAIARMEDDGRTVLVVAAGDGSSPQPRPTGVIGISDLTRPEAGATIARLLAGGIDHAVMLTGDNQRTAGAVARETGLTEFRARLLPADKTEAIRALKDRYGMVAMIGDGINDAPALALADIGIAMGAAGSDSALETADVALMSDDLRALPRFFELGRATVANIRQNVIVSVTIKLAVLVAALAGYAPLWLAVFADTGVALLVILNGLRLLRPR